MNLPPGWKLDEAETPAAPTLPEGWKLDAPEAPAAPTLPAGWKVEPDAPTQGVVKDSAKRAGRSLVDVPGALTQSLGTLLDMAARTMRTADAAQVEAMKVRRGELPGYTGTVINEMKKPSAKAQTVVATGKQMRADAADLYTGDFAPDPARDENLVAKVADNVGPLAAALATPGGVIAKTATGIALNSQAAADDAERTLKERGATDEEASTEAARQFVYNIPAGALESIAWGRLLGRYGKALENAVAERFGKTVLQRILKATAEQAVIEGGEEAVQQTVQNIAAQTYDPERKITQGTGESFILGSVMGGGMAGGVQTAAEVANKLDTGANKPEAPRDLAAQSAQLMKGDRAAQMFPLGTPELPLPEGMQRIETPRGVFHYNPRQITADEILTASKQGKENLILGLGPYSKTDLDARIQGGEKPATLVERGPNGEELRGALVTPSTEAETRRALEKNKSDGSTIEREQLPDTLARRDAPADTPDLDALMQEAADAMKARKEAAAKAAADREARQAEATAKRERFAGHLETARAAIANPTDFARVQGVVTTLRDYTEDNSIGLNLEQRQAARAMLGQLTPVLDRLKAQEDAAAEARTAAAQQAEEAKRAAVKDEKRALAQQKDIDPATGKKRLEAMTDDELVTEAESGNAAAFRVLEQRSAGSNEDVQRPDLMTVLRDVRLPATDATLGAELDNLREFSNDAKLFKGTRPLDRVAETLRTQHGFSQIQTPNDVIEFAKRAMAGEVIKPDAPIDDIQFSRTAVAAAPQKPRWDQTKGREQMQSYMDAVERYRRELTAWVAQSPDVLVFRDAFEPGQMNLVSRNVRPGEQPWRVTYFKDSKPIGHTAYATKQQAVDSMTAAAEYAPEVEFGENRATLPAGWQIVEGNDEAPTRAPVTPAPEAAELTDFEARLRRIAPGLMLEYRTLVGSLDDLRAAAPGVAIPNDVQAAHLQRKRILFFLQKNIHADKNGQMAERLRRDVLHESAHGWLNSLDRDTRDDLVQRWEADKSDPNGWLATQRKRGVKFYAGMSNDWAEYWAERIAFENTKWAQRREGVGANRGLASQLAYEFRSWLQQVIEFLQKAFNRTNRYNVDFRMFLDDSRYSRPEPAANAGPVSAAPAPLAAGRALKNGVQFSIQKTAAGVLIAVHNTSANTLRKIAELGGFAVPSLAVIKPDASQYTSFGEITLIAPKTLIDPKAESASKVFNADIYSPRFPTVRFTVSSPELRKAWDKLSKQSNALGNVLSTELDEDEIQRNGIEQFEKSAAVALAYLESKGIEQPVLMERTDPVSDELRAFKEKTTWALAEDPAFIEAATRDIKEQYKRFPDLLEEMLGEDGKPGVGTLSSIARRVIRNNYPEPDRYATERAAQDKIDAAGLRDDFKAWVRTNFARVISGKRVQDYNERTGNSKWLPYQLDDVVRVMKRTLRDGEGFNYGVGNIRANVALQFKSLQQMRDRADQIVPPEAMEKAKKESMEEFTQLAEELRPFYRFEKGFGYLDQVSQSFAELATKGPRAWAENFKEVPDDLMKQVAQFLVKLKNMPTEYFEAKIRRGVMLNEFVGAVVPDSIPADVRDLLKKSGLQVVEYPQSDKQARAAAVATFEDARFARTFMGREVPERFEDWLAQMPADVREALRKQDGDAKLRDLHQTELRLANAPAPLISAETFDPKKTTQDELQFARAEDPRETEKADLIAKLKQAEADMRADKIGADSWAWRYRDLLDTKFPGWDKSAPKPAPAANTAGVESGPTVDETADPAADLERDAVPPPEREFVDRPGIYADVEGHTQVREPWLERTKEGILDFLRGFRGSIPELPVFADDKSQNFLRLRQFVKLIKRGTPRVWKEASDSVGEIVQPLLKLGNLNPRSYERLAKFQARVRQLREDGRPVPPELTREITRLNTEIEAEPYGLFQKLALYLDLKWRVENLKDDQGNPITQPGSLNVKEIDTRLDQLKKVLAANPHKAAVMKALRDHQALVKQIGDDMRERELTLPEDFQNPFYFPHVVIEKNAGTLDRVKLDTAEDFRSYLIKPVGSAKPLETDYAKAMYYHLVAVGSHNLRSDLVRDYLKPYDKMDEVRDRAKALAKQYNRPVSWREAFATDYANKGFKLFYPDDKLPLSPEMAVSRDVLAQRLGVILTSEPLQEQLQKLGMTGIKLLPEDIHQALAAGERETWVLPETVADALNGVLRRETARSEGVGKVLGDASRMMQGTWKKWMLYAPQNYIRYEYGNTVADLEKLFSADPEVFKLIPQAAREVRQFIEEGKGGRDVHEAFKLGVLDSVTAAEVNDLTALRQFEALKTTGDNVRDILKRITTLGLAGKRSTTDVSKLREAAFRFAKFKADLTRLRNNARPVYAGAYYRDIDAITDSRPGANDANYHKAAEISLATFGDYNNISTAGQFFRQHLVPFYSWMEINFKYHANLLRNLKDMTMAGDMSRAKAMQAGGRAAAAVASTFTRKAAASFMLRLALPYIAVALWNNSGDREELEETLSAEDRRRFHIIVGKDADGKTMVIYANTALADVAKWFGGPDAARLAIDAAQGRTDPGTAFSEWLQKFPRDFANNLFQVGPAFRVPYTIMTGKNTFPDVTDQRTIPANEIKWAVLGQMTDQVTAELIRRAADKDYLAGRDLGDWTQQLILQTRKRDPQQWAFYEIKDKAADFLEAKTGQSRDSSYNAPDQQVLRNFRRSIYRGDTENAVRFYNRLLELGYTSERFKSSIRAQDPLSALPKELRREFVESLSRYEYAQLKRAFEFYARMTEQRGAEGALFPSERMSEAGRARYQPRNDRLRQEMSNAAQLDDAALAARAEQELARSLRPAVR